MGKKSKKKKNNTPKVTEVKSVLLTVKEDGSLAIAANQDGSIAYEVETVEVPPDQNDENENVNEPENKVSTNILKLFVVMAIIFCLAYFGNMLRLYLAPRHVDITINTMDDSININTEVPAHSIGEALEKLGIYVSDMDVVLPYLTEKLEDNTSIEITKRLPSRVTVAGKEQNMILTPGTIEEVLAFNNIEYDEDDIVSPKLTKSVNVNSDIEIKDVEIVIKKKKKKIGFEEKIILDPNVASGVLVEDEGKEGKALYTYTYTYVNGKKTDTKKEFTKWISKPQDHVIHLGTSATGHSGEVSIRRTFTSNTTAYYAGKNGRGALGTRCHYGTVAVDPRVFPYGSTFWISGYGFGYANDCGGAIKGTKLDLYMRSNRECYRWGRRWVTAYLLG